MMTIDGWKTTSLPLLLRRMKSGGTPDTSRSDYYGGDIPFVTIEDMTACNRHLTSTIKTLTDEGLKNSNAWVVPANSILYSIYATLGLPRINTVPVTTNQAILALINDPNKIDRDYLYYWFEHIRAFVVNFSSQTTQSNLNATIVKTFLVDHPTDLSEQTKIAVIFSTVNRAIEQTEALIAKQQRIKTGLMQDLLTRGIDEHGNLRSEQTHRFKDSPLGRIPVEWEVRTLDRLTKAIVDCPHTTPQFTQGGILVARTFNIKEGQFLGEQSYISNEEYKERILRLEPQKGDVIFTREAPVGEAFLIPVNFKVCLGQRTMLLRCVLNECLPEYLVEVIYSEDMRIRFDQKVGGTTNPHLNVGDVRSLAIKQPPIKEQLKITALLVEIRKTLNCYDQEKSKLCSIKTALMQDLLTGKKRVTALLNDAEVGV